eukprot:TRINITY_DN10594_c0_g1_i1.p1 TRINITY_DN10594_c0_g1~~TRINITY_DN10594_c0_g1_i1.p1  ORF type:complete len:1009 (-),score=253.52 TRINITY_DN10594_c0_g1_i1:149-2809(-)
MDEASESSEDASDDADAEYDEDESQTTPKRRLVKASTKRAVRPTAPAAIARVKRAEKQKQKQKEKSPRKRGKLSMLWKDDGLDANYRMRSADWRDYKAGRPSEYADVMDDLEIDLDVQDEHLSGGLTVSASVQSRLFPYQRTGLKWLWELHAQDVGGILCDEMGLGKTIQIVSFISALHYSKLLRGAVLIACPATVMRQWVYEFHIWYPDLRVAILHDSGDFSGNKTQLIEGIATHGHVLITTYEGIRVHQEALLRHKWFYVVLDEGHKIRNPDAEITLACKRFRTPHRIILSGAPIQNKLTELWSLFDFVFPGRLGTLPVFQQQFEVPIQQGGYANAKIVQVRTAFKCATVLRDLINPYLLRRIKSDVLTLPAKNDQVLFCRLNDAQRAEYLSYLSSREVEDILGGRRRLLAGISVLRKICNHPGLYTKEDRDNWRLSSKLCVLDELLPMWHQQGHRVLLFSQGVKMLTITENMVREHGWTYRRMDGGTSIGSRAALVEEYNNDPDIFLFLLTTKVGGLGLNLCGADRVIILDPDWNPATDTQARERVWRIGQQREVTIYRLVTTGTIEEKIYQRQIFKQFLTTKILKDPRQKRFFKARDLADLFTFNDRYETTETGDLFSHAQTLAEDLVAAPHSLLPPPAATDTAGPADGAVQPYADEHRREAANDDTFILRRLFESGVHGALSHDTIVDISEPEKVIVEQEAEKVARTAMAALRASRQARAQHSRYDPTWTGQNGVAGAPVRPRFGAVKRGGGDVNAVTQASVEQFGNTSAGLATQTAGGASTSSSQLLQRLRARQLDGGSGSASKTGLQGLHGAAALIEPLHDLIAKRGRVPTAEIVAHFRDQVAHDELSVFRRLLREVAVLKRDADGVAAWELRGDTEAE